jgi:MazG family protein
MQESSALGRIVDLVRDLRRRCPWDGAQTRTTLRPYLVEEALELDQALRSGDSGQVLEELGDVLLHVAFQVVLGEEAGEFGAEDVAQAVERKMWRRHPHLFSASGDEIRAGRVEDTWERTKLNDAAADRPSVLDGVPRRLPALLAAYRLGERAAGVGFDWPDASGPLEKVQEEVAELEAEVSRSAPVSDVESELGDLLFATVNLARKLGIDPRSALEKANTKFEARFRRVEELARQRGIDVGRAGLEALDRLWDETKAEARDRASSSSEGTQSPP